MIIMSDEVEKAKQNILSAAARAMGRRGGKIGGPKGGKRRAEVLSSAERKRIALMGGRARWRQRPTQET